MPAPVRVLICDDHPIVREALRSRFESAPDIEVAGEAGNGEEVVSRAIELDPDLVMVDVEMPVLDGISASRRLSEARPEIRVIVFTAHDEPNLAALAANAGASGYLVKSASEDEMTAAVRTVAAGDTWFPHGIPEPGRHDELFRLQSLSTREREILELLATGLRADGVARKLEISPATVHTHVRNAIARLGVGSRTQAVAIATRYGFIARDR